MQLSIRDIFRKLFYRVSHFFTIFWHCFNLNLDFFASIFYFWYKAHSSFNHTRFINKLKLHIICWRTLCNITSLTRYLSCLSLNFTAVFDTLKVCMYPFNDHLESCCLRWIWRCNVQVGRFIYKVKILADHSLIPILFTWELHGVSKNAVLNWSTRNLFKANSFEGCESLLINRCVDIIPLVGHFVDFVHKIVKFYCAF